MTTKQELFLQKYLENGYNATKAYMDIYNVTELVAKASSSRLLANANLQSVISEYKADLAKKSEITKEEMLKELKDILSNTRISQPRNAISAINEINRMLGFWAPTETHNTNNNIEQPLFPDIFTELPPLPPKKLD